MPAKSKAQLRKIGELEEQGKVKPGTTKEWAKGVDVQKLPERVKLRKGPAHTSVESLQDTYKKRFGVK